MTENPSSFQAVCYGKCEITGVFANVSSEVVVCDKFRCDGINDALCVACGFCRNFHIQEDSPIDDSFWDSLGPLSGGKESPWHKSFRSPPPSPPAVKAPSEAGRAPARRQRTKFTEKQVAEMEELARASGWRRRKRDRARIDERCQGMHVDPEKYKTWLKNKKAALRKERMMA